jgi:type II secretory pathway pseudopilin PulG
LRTLHEIWKKDWLTIVCLLIIGIALSIVVFKYPESQHIIEIAAGVLAVITLILAIRQYFDAAKHTTTLESYSKTLQTYANHLDAISQSLSTRYLGAYPDYLPDITALIENIHRQLTIFCDVPAYGRVRAADYYYNYKQTIERKLGKKDFCIQFIHLNEVELTKVFYEQYPHHEWPNWKDSHKELVEDFLEGTSYSVDNIPYEDFLRLNMKCNTDLIKNEDVFNHSRVEREESHLPISMCFWIRDKDQEAIFTLINFTGTGDVEEFGFYTVDGSLIKALHSVFARYRGFIREYQSAEGRKKSETPGA